jgi:hypothetical protein
MIEVTTKAMCIQWPGSLVANERNVPSPGLHEFESETRSELTLVPTAWFLANCRCRNSPHVYRVKHYYLTPRSDRLHDLVVRFPDYRSRGPGFDSQHYQIFWEIVGLERGPFSLVSTTEELLGINSSGSGLENREYGLGNPLRWPRNTSYPQ